MSKTCALNLANPSFMSSFGKLLYASTMARVLRLLSLSQSLDPTIFHRNPKKTALIPILFVNYRGYSTNTVITKSSTCAKPSQDAKLV
jgi:hypothetical protein